MAPAKNVTQTNQYKKSVMIFFAYFFLLGVNKYVATKISATSNLVTKFLTEHKYCDIKNWLQNWFGNKQKIEKPLRPKKVTKQKKWIKKNCDN